MAMPRSAIILAGNSATSKSGIEDIIPKPLLTVADRRLIEFSVETLIGAGIRRLLIVLDLDAVWVVGRLKGLLETFAIEVECVVQDTPRGTGGTIKEAEEWLGGETFWVMGGDLFVGSDIRPMAAIHCELGLMATVGVVRTRETAWDMERVEVDNSGRVRTIHRIHPAYNRRSTLRPVGLYLFESKVLESIPKRSHFDLKEQLFSALSAQGNPAGVWEIPGYCRNVLSVADYLSVSQEVLLGRVRTPRSQYRCDGAADEWAKPVISPDAILVEPVVIGKGSRICGNAMVIGPSAIGENCLVEKDGVVIQSVLLPDSTVGTGALVDRSILAEGSRVEDGERLREMIVLEGRVMAIELLSPSGRHIPLTSSGLLEAPAWMSKSRRISQLTKRILDLMVAGVALVLLSPLMAIIALAIRLDSKGDILFGQRRCGRGGQEFTMYKFRSMVEGSEDLKRELLAMNEVDGPMFKIVTDPRVTAIGKLLRATNADELPQLWNVLRGQMSLVGPRPLSMDEMRFSPMWRDIRLRVKPGLTGLWQAEAHSKLSFADWIRHDMFYVRHQSLWLDCKIIFKTALKCLSLGA